LKEKILWNIVYTLAKNNPQLFVQVIDKQLPIFVHKVLQENSDPSTVVRVFELFQQVDQQLAWDFLESLLSLKLSSTPSAPLARCLQFGLALFSSSQGFIFAREDTALRFINWVIYHDIKNVVLHQTGRIQTVKQTLEKELEMGLRTEEGEVVDSQLDRIVTFLTKLMSDKFYDWKHPASELPPLNNYHHLVAKMGLQLLSYFGGNTMVLSPTKSGLKIWRAPFVALLKQMCQDRDPIIRGNALGIEYQA